MRNLGDPMGLESELLTLKRSLEALRGDAAAVSDAAVEVGLVSGRERYCCPLDPHIVYMSTCTSLSRARTI